MLNMIELSKVGDSNVLKMHRRQLKGDAKWADIQDLINRWAKRSPAQAIALEKYIKSSQEGLIDKKHGLITGKTGNDNQTATRIGVALHPELLSYIQAFYPDFMDSKEDLHTFKKKFPKFRVSEAV